MKKLISCLEMFLKEEVVLLLKGDHSIEGYEHKIPMQWREVLLTEMPMQQVIETVWQPIAGDLLDLPKIVGQITNIGLVASASHRLPIGLLYMFRHTKSDELFSWLGYPPANPSQLIQFEKKAGFPLPSSYQKFTSIHNGLLRDGWNSHGLRPIEKLYLIEVNQKRIGLGQHLLAFSGDGTGNEQCYDLSLPTNLTDYLTVDLDHESHNSGTPYLFRKYLEMLLKTEMGVRD